MTQFISPFLLQNGNDSTDKRGQKKPHVCGKVCAGRKWLYTKEAKYM